MVLRLSNARGLTVKQVMNHPGISEEAKIEIWDLYVLRFQQLRKHFEEIGVVVENHQPYQSADQIFIRVPGELKPMEINLHSGNVVVDPSSSEMWIIDPV